MSFREDYNTVNNMDFISRVRQRRGELLREGQPLSAGFNQAELTRASLTLKDAAPPIPSAKPIY